MKTIFAILLMCFTGFAFAQDDVYKGDQGNAGPEGPEWSEGPQGPEGSEGPQGLKGDEGSEGLEGAGEEQPE